MQSLHQSYLTQCLSGTERVLGMVAYVLSSSTQEAEAEGSEATHIHSLQARGLKSKA